ncbi:MAG: ABC transporter permease [Cyclobacteriaceae bacterium]
MIKNYIKITLRNLANQKLYAFLNVLGLSIGIASCLLIMLYIYHELSYDTFHERADRIYRVGLNGKIADQEVYTTNTTPPLAFTAIEEFPEVQNATRMYTHWGDQIVRYGETVISEEDVYLVDSTFFDVFSFPLLAGDPQTALVEPNSIVIPEDEARKYFGDEPALGKTLLLGNDKTPHTITGVLEELPDNSHFHFSMLRAMSTLEYSRQEGWFNNSFQTYLLLHEGASAESLEAKLPGLVAKYVGPEVQQFLGVSLEDFFAQGNKYGYFLQPLLDIHLYSDLEDELEPNGDITYVYILAAIGFFIILLACINFMNLATARSGNRAKEVGIRKTLGSLRTHLIRQFMSESVLLSLIATVLGLASAWLLLSPFNNLAGKEISDLLFIQPWFLLSLFGLMLLVGVLAGSYPAFYLSSFRPAEVLKGKIKAGMKSSGIRNGLVVFQFFVSITLIICTLLVYRQLEYTRTKNLGFEKENVVVVDGLWRLEDGKQEALRQALISQSSIINASISNNVPPGVNNTTVFRKKADEQDVMVSTYHVDYDHLPTMDIELLEGRNFSPDFPTDTIALLLNEAAVRAFNLDDPLGEEIQYFGGSEYGQSTYFKVVGVFKDFNFETLKNNIRPLALMLSTDGGHISVRTAPGDVSASLATIENIWKEYAPDQPFQYSFLDEDFDALFRAEQRLGQVFTVFTGLAILVACLGLLGLAAFMAEQRTKEIGIRKVMGASVTNIAVLLSKDFTKLVVIAFILSIPLAYFIMQSWLKGFAFRIDIGPGTFILAGTAALLIAWLTVSWQSIKAASADPVKSLRSE